MPLWIQIPANRNRVACSSIFYLLKWMLKCNNPSFYVRATPVDFSGARVLRSYTKLFLPRNPLQSEILIINSGGFRVFVWVFNHFLWIKLPSPTPRRPTPCRAGSSILNETFLLYQSAESLGTIEARCQRSPV